MFIKLKNKRTVSKNKCNNHLQRFFVLKMFTRQDITEILEHWQKKNSPSCNTLNVIGQQFL